jgi:hypothetical protein
MVTNKEIKVVAEVLFSCKEKQTHFRQVCTNYEPEHFKNG